MKRQQEQDYTAFGLDKITENIPRTPEIPKPMRNHDNHIEHYDHDTIHTTWCYLDTLEPTLY